MEDHQYSSSSSANAVDAVYQYEEKSTNLSSPSQIMTESKKNILENTQSDSDLSNTGRVYLSGVRLFAIMLSITLAAFLLLLDSSIISTVSRFVILI